LLSVIFSLAQSFSSAENRFDSDPIIHGLAKSLPFSWMPPPNEVIPEIEKFIAEGHMEGA
jgi:hypothetical protein